MKTRIFSLTGGTIAVAVVGLLLATDRMQGEANPATTDTAIADTNSIVGDTTNAPPPAPATYGSLPSAIPASELALTNAPPPAPAGVKLSKGAADIARFAQSGIAEDVMLAYVAGVNSPFNLGSDQIVYLNDLGVSGNVVKAMIQRDTAIATAAQAYAATLTPPSVNPSYPVPTDDGTAPGPDTTMTPPYDPNAYVPTDDAQYFYTSLSPYGCWTYLAGVGLCWQPTVYIGNHDWRPYCDRGRWLYSDSGWYWQSDYSWGWAAFHYGRWFEDPHCGWVWCPDRVWGPAWVSWRSSGNYCGWAPLPPSARFISGTGFVFANHVVGAGFEFGLRAHHYTFIPLERMTDYTPGRYAVARWQAEEIRNQTRVVTQVTEHNHHLFSRGVDPASIAAVTTTEIRHAEIREQANNEGHHFAPSDRLSKGSSGGLVIYRPQLPTPAHHATGGNGTAPASQPSRNPNGPRTSVTPTTPVATTSSQNDAFVARLKALQQQAIANQKAIEEQAAAARQANASHAETYPAGSLVLHGNGNTHPAASQANYANTAGNSAWPSEAPTAHSYGGYTVVNGFARPASQAAPQDNQAPHVIPGRYSASQRMSGNSATYTVTSGPTQQLNSHAQQISDAANAQVMPGHFTAAQQLNNAPAHNYGADATTHLNSHSQQIMEAASRSHSEPPHQEQHVESHHFESHSESHASYSAPASAPAPASHGSSGGGSSSPSSGKGK